MSDQAAWKTIFCVKNSTTNFALILAARSIFCVNGDSYSNNGIQKYDNTTKKKKRKKEGTILWQNMSKVDF